MQSNPLLVLIMKHSKIFKYGFIAAILLGTYIGYRAFLNNNPQFAYEWITGNKIPEGVVVVSYGSLSNDNLFHSGYCWEFSHSEVGLLNILKQIGAGKEYENYKNVTDYQGYDVIWSLSDIDKALGKKIDKNTIGKGYEITGKNNRDNWFLINKTGDRSYYEFN